MNKNSEQNILTQIDSPSDLRLLTPNNLERVCRELRKYIIDVLADNPGHFASSLGTVELTVALHYALNTPYDRIIWDVGHQAYGHKILTGRREAFKTLRKMGGIGSFPDPSESEYDSFVAGHASNSISAALGMNVASALKGESDRKHVAVIGDGSMTGGLAFEGLNNAAVTKNNLLIILNDNNMAIDKPVGGMSEYLVNITTSKTYNKIRFRLYNALKRIGLIQEETKGIILRFNNSLKALLTQQHNIFEGLNIRYFGPVDGHDVCGLVRIINDIKNMTGPKILHIQTVKGKGFKPAEEHATEWHSPGKFNRETGERIIVRSKNEPQLYQDTFGHTLVELAKSDERIVGVTPAMPTGCSMTFLMKEMPHRAFDVGIAEGHAVTFSAGLAKEGMMPFCNIYSSFMQRAYDNIIHDSALQNLDMVLCLDRAGLVGEDGATHHGVFDLAYLRCIPNITIASPLNEIALRNLMFTASRKGNGVFAIRYPRGKGEMRDLEKPFELMPVGKGQKLADGKDVAVLSIGPIGNIVTEAIVRAKEKGVNASHYDMIYLKPVDEAILNEVGQNFKKIITVENGVIQGGLGSVVAEFMSSNGYSPFIKRLGIPDEFITQGTIPELHHLCGIDEEGITETILSFFT
ncbi:MAG: 1-deoxy-D-xylulose-5-phosphate synthase [Dysgonamonadaceae bacterium]|jgi:1-deoxy-D-xylulose-5-phosphate synthase|nr:1-deoxy-D-xylulose-5-phosphate synthase [Dysgonamonadaceae bacterium]